MTTNILCNEVDKDFDYDLDKILNSIVDEDGICKTCGQDHSLKVRLNKVIITINQIHKLFEKEFLEEPNI